MIESIKYALVRFKSSKVVYQVISTKHGLITLLPWSGEKHKTILHEEIDRLVIVAKYKQYSLNDFKGGVP